MRFFRPGFMLVLVFLSVSVFSQQKYDTPLKVDKRQNRKGWFIFPLPIVSYNSDIGLKIGGMVNLYDYGKGKVYPDYKHLIYLQATYSSKNSGVFRIMYDSDKLLKINGKPLRVTAEVNYSIDGGLNFYGFNGYESNFGKKYIDPHSPAYITRLYYKINRKLLNLYLSLQGNIAKEKLRWFLGFTSLNYNIKKAQRNKLSIKEKHLPDTTTLYEDYVKYGLIRESEAKGGLINFINVGLVFDNRDIKANANKGFWDEIILYSNPAFFTDKSYKFISLSAIHRQYITLIKKKLTFAYRLGAKMLLAGRQPFFFTSYMVSSFTAGEDHDGLGGATTLRGVNRNRIMANGTAYGNFCFRYKFWKFGFMGNPSYLALNAFMDIGQSIQDFPTEATIKQIMEKDYPGRYFYKSSDKPHISFGGGVHFAMSENFVLKINAGRSINPQDGPGSIYFTTDWIF